MDQNARKIVIRTLLKISIDLFQNNLRLIRLERTTFYYECNLRKFKILLSKGEKSPIKMINPKVHQRLLTPHRLMVISWSRKVMSFCYGYILMKVNLRVVDWRRQARSKLKKPNCTSPSAASAPKSLLFSIKLIFCCAIFVIWIQKENFESPFSRSFQTLCASQ